MELGRGLVIVLLLVTVIFFGRKIFIKIGKRFGSSDLTLSEIKQRHRAGLAFNTRHILLPGKDMDYPVKDINENTAYAGSHISGLIKNALLMLALSAGGVFLCGWVIKNYDNPEVMEAVATPFEGTYTGDVQGTPSTIKLYQNEDGIWEADMTINYRAGNNAVVYLACAPKSVSVYKAFNKMRAFVKQDGTRPVPMHIRNAPTKLMQKVGNGAGYRYPPDEPGSFEPPMPSATCSAASRTAR